MAFEENPNYSGAHAVGTVALGSPHLKDAMDWLLFGPSMLIAHWPYAGYVVGAILGAVAVWRRLKIGLPFDLGFFRDPIVFAGILWMVFNAYERQTTAIASQSSGVGVTGAFRMDLIVLIPILYVMSAAAVVAIVGKLKPQSSSTEDTKESKPRD